MKSFRTHFKAHFKVICIASIASFLFACSDGDTVYYPYNPSSIVNLTGTWHWQNKVQLSDSFSTACPMKAGDSTMITLTFSQFRYSRNYALSGFAGQSSDTLIGRFNPYSGSSDMSQFNLGDLFLSGGYSQGGGKTVVYDDFRVVNDSLILGEDNWTWANDTAHCVGQSAIVATKF